MIYEWLLPVTRTDGAGVSDPTRRCLKVRTKSRQFRVLFWSPQISNPVWRKNKIKRSLFDVFEAVTWLLVKEGSQGPNDFIWKGKIYTFDGDVKIMLRGYLDRGRQRKGECQKVCVCVCLGERGSVCKREQEWKRKRETDRQTECVCVCVIVRDGGKGEKV